MFEPLQLAINGRHALPLAAPRPGAVPPNVAWSDAASPEATPYGVTRADASLPNVGGSAMTRPGAARGFDAAPPGSPSAGGRRPDARRPGPQRRCPPRGAAARFRIW